jgi:hypothetical protein
MRKVARAGLPVEETEASRPSLPQAKFGRRPGKPTMASASGRLPPNARPQIVVHGGPTQVNAA